MSEPNELTELALAEIAALSQRPNLTLEVPALTAFIVISHLQLAMRHPQNVGPSKVIVDRFVGELRRLVSKPGDPIDTLIRMGFDERFDVNQQ